MFLIRRLEAIGPARVIAVTCAAGFGFGRLERFTNHSGASSYQE